MIPSARPSTSPKTRPTAGWIPAHGMAGLQRGTPGGGHRLGIVGDLDDGPRPRRLTHRHAEPGCGSTPFNGGEGAWYGEGKVWFTTKGDNRVWELDVRATPQIIRVIYDDSSSSNPVLTGVDNIVGSASGDLFVAEDPGNLELVLLEPGGATSAFLRALNQNGSDLAGPAVDPSGTRLYFSSQRGPTGTGPGVTYEVRGPFRTAVSPTTTIVASTTTSTVTTSTTKRKGPRPR